MFDTGSANFERRLSSDGCIGSSTSERRGALKV